jgi:hypothetical protein
MLHTWLHSCYLNLNAYPTSTALYFGESEREPGNSKAAALRPARCVYKLQHKCVCTIIINIINVSTYMEYCDMFSPPVAAHTNCHFCHVIPGGGLNISAGILTMMLVQTHTSQFPTICNTNVVDVKIIRWRTIMCDDVITHDPPRRHHFLDVLLHA